MKQFYACEPKQNIELSIRKEEWVEYDINTLIRDEAETILSCDDRFADLSDDEFFELVIEKAKKIKDELIENGIYKNEWGQPLFLYC
jgi:hypothetical protein